MNINTLIKRQNLSLYELSKTSGVPYSTLKDISHGKSKIEKCSAGTVYRIANALHVSSDDLLEPCFFRRPDFSVYKSEICHQVKELGDIPFLVQSMISLWQRNMMKSGASDWNSLCTRQEF